MSATKSLAKIFEEMNNKIEILEKEVKELKNRKDANELFEEIMNNLRNLKDIRKASGK